MHKAKFRGFVTLSAKRRPHSSQVREADWRWGFTGARGVPPHQDLAEGPEAARRCTRH